MLRITGQAQPLFNLWEKLNAEGWNKELCSAFTTERKRKINLKHPRLRSKSHWAERGLFLSKWDLRLQPQQYCSTQPREELLWSCAEKCIPWKKDRECWIASTFHFRNKAHQTQWSFASQEVCFGTQISLQQKPSSQGEKRGSAWAKAIPMTGWCPTWEQLRDTAIPILFYSEINPKEPRYKAAWNAPQCATGLNFPKLASIFNVCAQSHVCPICLSFQFPLN